MAGSTRTDARTVASLAALGRSVDWYLARAPSAAEVPISIEAVRLLRAALDGGVGWSVALFEALVVFGSVMFRMARVSADVPACNVGDALTAMTALPSTAHEPPWPFDPDVDPETFAKLGFAETSAGIARSRRNNPDGWGTHADHCRALIEVAAGLAERRRLAVVVGAGHGFDLPLASLARSFDQLVLIDVDRAPVDAAVAGLRDATARIDVRVRDVTGINRAIVASLDALVAGPGAADEVWARVEAHCRSYRLPETPTFLEPGEQADLVVSSCVVSQLAWPQRAYAYDALVRRFGRPSSAAERSWSLAWAELELRVQQDHINGIAAAADRSVLISDTVNHLTAFDAAGTERVTAEKVPALGVESLLERAPCPTRVERRETWFWPRHRPSPHAEPGSLMAVEGLVLRG